MSWEVLNIKTEAKKKLKRVQKLRGFSSLSDTIEFLVEVHANNEKNITAKIAEQWRNK